MTKFTFAKLLSVTATLASISAPFALADHGQGQGQGQGHNRGNHNGVYSKEGVYTKGGKVPLSWDERVCYRWESFFEDERLVLNFKKHSDLFPTSQESYSITGKETGVCGTNTMAASFGSSVVSHRDTDFPNIERGAHLGIQTTSLRGNSVTDTCRIVNYDCTSTEAVVAPHEWTCRVENGFGIHFDVRLRRVTDPEGDRFCRVFQDGEVETVPLKEALSVGPGSATAAAKNK